MNIILRELKANRKSLIIWSLTMIFMVYVGMVKYSGISGAGSAGVELFSQLPKSVIAIFGLNGIDIGSISGFYSMFFLYFMLLAGIHAVFIGSSIISKEERDKTADYLYVKPRSRWAIITYKLIAAFINIVIINLVTCLASIQAISIYNKGPDFNKGIILMMVALFVFQLIFMFLGAGISSISRNPKKTGQLSALILLAAYIFSAMIDLNNKLDNLKFLTPFKYFDSKELIKGVGLENGYVLLSSALILVFIGVTYIFYKKRDLHV